MKMKGEAELFPTWFMFYARWQKGLAMGRTRGYRAVKVTVRSGKLFESFQSFRFGLNVRGRPAARVVDVSGFLVARVSSSYREDESDTELLELAIREELLNRFYEDALANNKRESILDSIYIRILICILTCTDDIRFVYYELLSLLNIATCSQFRQNATDKGRCPTRKLKKL